MTSIRTHLRTNVVGYVALFCALSAGAYAAGLAPNSVKSKHIKDGQVANADIRSDAIAGPNVVGNAISGPKVLDASLGGTDLAPNSLGGQQIAENTLGEVPRATIAGHGGFGRQSGLPTSCIPPDLTELTCASVDLNISAAARVMVVGRFEAKVDGGVLSCALGSSDFGTIPGSTVRIDHDGEFVTLVGITESLQAGNHSFGIDCYEPADSVEVENATVTAVAISPY